MDHGDNQQATPTEGEIAWLAGIIEGEGTLMMGLQQRNDKAAHRVGLQIKVYNSDAAIMRKVSQIFERLAVGFHLRERDMPAMRKFGGEGFYVPSAPMLTITVSKMHTIHKVLVAIRPWLFGDKSARADLMIEFLERRFAKFEDDALGKRAKYDADDIRVVLQFAKGGKRADVATVERVLNELEQDSAVA